MSLAIIKSRSSQLQATDVFIEVHLGNGLPCINMVGLPETAVKESKDRVRGAITNCRFDFPIRRITINLAPADLPKEGSRFDLAIAIGILVASGQIHNNPKKPLADFEFYAELALSGELRPISGIIPAAIQAKKAGKTIIVSQQNAQEAMLVEGLSVLYAHNLLEVSAFFNGRAELFTEQKQKMDKRVIEHCFSDVKGQQQAKRAFTIAAAGSHSLLLSGPPGSGKTMLSSCMPNVLPVMTEEQAMESAAIRSINGEFINTENWLQRPFRTPHHTASAVALVGGGSHPKPGEISLAHNGVLFLDELPEFSRHVLEVLREPLESGFINISRAAQQVKFPANFQLIAAMNPCPCGYLGDNSHECRCTSEQVQRYQNRLSGPLLDRIDMFVQLYAVPHDELFAIGKNSAQDVESSVAIQQKATIAHQKQLRRQGKVNAKLSSKEIEHYCQLSDENMSLLDQAVKRLKLSVRAYHRVLRVAMTIADLDPKQHKAGTITNQHLSEAIQYRKKTSNLFR